MSQIIAAGEALSLNALVTPTAHGIASRVLAKTAGGSVTLFAIDATRLLLVMLRTAAP